VGMVYFGWLNYKTVYRVLAIAALLQGWLVRWVLCALQMCCNVRSPIRDFALNAFCHLKASGISFRVTYNVPALGEVANFGTDYFLSKIKFLAKCKREFTTKFAILPNACACCTTTNITKKSN